MDEIKDVTKKDLLTRFLNSTSIRTDAFGHNISCERAYRRAERIAAAVHLVTNHVAEHEPVRTAARRAAVDLLSSILSLREELRSPESQGLLNAEGKVRRLISLVRILVVSGRISLQNAAALIEALDELGVSLAAAQRSGLSERVSLGKEDFLIGQMHIPKEVVSDMHAGRRRSHAKDTRAHAMLMPAGSPQTRERAEEILSVLGNQEQLGIKDIAANLPAYSEKMIQRELKHLVELGRVKKIGSKRWSMYALAQ